MNQNCLFSTALTIQYISNLNIYNEATETVERSMAIVWDWESPPKHESKSKDNKGKKSFNLTIYNTIC
jgi:hypothetical protein